MISKILLIALFLIVAVAAILLITYLTDDYDY